MTLKRVHGPYSILGLQYGMVYGSSCVAHFSVLISSSEAGVLPLASVGMCASMHLRLLCMEANAHLHRCTYMPQPLSFLICAC